MKCNVLKSCQKTASADFAGFESTFSFRKGLGIAGIRMHGLRVVELGSGLGADVSEVGCRV